jgi:hypothetical protein
MKVGTSSDHAELLVNELTTFSTKITLAATRRSRPGASGTTTTWSWP